MNQLNRTLGVYSQEVFMIFIFDIYRLKLIAFDFNEGNNFCIGFYRTFDLDEGFETLMHLKCIKMNMNIASTFYF